MIVILKKSVAYFLVAFVFVSSAIAKVELRSIAMRGQTPVGVGNGVYFSTFFDPTINSNGQIAFEASMFDPAEMGGVSKSSVWIEDGNGNLELVALAGEQAPGAPIGTNYESFNGIYLNNRGDLAFGGTISGAGGSFLGLNEFNGTNSLLAYQGSPVSGSMSGAMFEQIDGPQYLTDDGKTLAAAITTASPNVVEYRLFDSDGDTAVIDLSILSGKSANETLGPIYVAKSANPSGEILFQIQLTGSSISDSNDFGLWLFDDASIQNRLVAREGDHAPGTSLTTTYDRSAFSDLSFNPSLSSNGSVAFSARLVGPEVNNSNNQGIWSEGRGNGLELIARTGDSAPGTNSGVVFQSFRHVEVSINASGHVAFWGALSGPEIGFGDGGLWSDGMSEGLKLVHLDGTPAPGAAGVSVSTYQINSLGQVMFLGFFGGTTGNQGLWAQDVNGDLRLIAKTGQAIDVEDGPGVDLRIISLISSGSRFNDLGQIVFQARFTDGSEGVFISNAVAIPEPALIQMLLVLAMVLIAPRGLSDRGRDCK